MQFLLHLTIITHTSGGGKLVMHGQVSEQSRETLPDVFSTYVPKKVAADFAARMVRTQIAMVYALNDDLRKGSNKDFRNKYFPYNLNRQTSSLAHDVLMLQSATVRQLFKMKAIHPVQFIQLDNVIKSMNGSISVCQRINETIFPPMYIFFTRVFTWLFVITTTLALAPTIELWSIIISFLIGFIFHITLLNGLLLINPFERAPGCVPIDHICAQIEGDLLNMINEKPAAEPTKPEDNGYVL